MTHIDRTTIQTYANAIDRVDHYDDSRELRAFASFLRRQYDPQTYRVVEKPDGAYGVDLGIVTHTGVRVGAFDLERCLSWRDDWPAHWQSLSFLARKDRYLREAQFGMVWFNASITTCVVAWKEDILAAPIQTRTFAGQSYTDRVRRVPFAAGTLIGDTFASGEHARFSQQIHFNFSDCL